MATRALEILDHKGAIIRPFTVPAAKTVTRGQAVKHSGADDAVENVAATTDFGIGIALDAGVAGDTVRVALWGSGIVKALVGTGAATRGAPAKFVADGLTDGTNGGGSTNRPSLGQFLESGVAGDLVALNLGAFSFSVGS